LNFNLGGGEFVKKLLSVVVVISVLLSVGFAAKGGVAPLLAGCCLGPRVGLEMNEGSAIRMTEWARFIPFVGSIVPLYSAYEAYTGKTWNQVSDAENLNAVKVYGANKQKDKLIPTVVACCWGPRVGLEMNNGRKLRNMELLMLVPVVNIIPLVVIASEGYNGKTMSQVAAAEGLDK